MLLSSPQLYCLSFLYYHFCFAWSYIHIIFMFRRNHHSAVFFFLLFFLNNTYYLYTYYTYEIIDIILQSLAVTVKSNKGNKCSCDRTMSVWSVFWTNCQRKPWTNLLCNFVDNRCKIGGPIELHHPQALEISFHNPFYAPTVWILIVTILQQTTWTQFSVNFCFCVFFFSIRITQGCWTYPKSHQEIQPGQVSSPTQGIPFTHT